MNGCDDLMTRAQRRAGQGGLTLLELMVSILASAIIIMGIGRIVTTNQTMIKGGSDKAILQQEMTRALTLITSDVRAARAVVATGDNGFTILDRTGAQAHVYVLAGTGDEARISRDGAQVTDRICSALTAVASADSTNLLLDLTFVDPGGNRVAGHTAASVRNKTMEF